MAKSYASVFRPGLFNDQVVIVTGGGSGIGRCTAHELASLGAKVALIGRNLRSSMPCAKNHQPPGEVRRTAGFAISREENKVRRDDRGRAGRDFPASMACQQCGRPNSAAPLAQTTQKGLGRGRAQ